MTHTRSRYFSILNASRFIYVSIFIAGSFFSAQAQAQVNALPDDSLASDSDRKFISRAYEIARKAVANGNYPFGALLVHKGKIVAEYENSVSTSRDVTQHAETGLISFASKKISPEILSECTLFTSTEPCIMCCGAIYWAHIKRFVFGTSESQMDLVAGYDQKNAPIASREVFQRLKPETIIIGPVLEKEGIAIHASFANEAKKRSGK